MMLLARLSVCLVIVGVLIGCASNETSGAVSPSDVAKHRAAKEAKG